MGFCWLAAKIIFLQAILDISINAVDPTCSIVLYGRTGCGKSYIANRLKAPGQPKLLEGSGDSSVTANVTLTNSWLDDCMLVEIPGYFDSEGRDRQNQAIFVDFMKNKTVKALLFIYTDRADSFMRHAAKAFQESEMGNNVIFVKNKVLDRQVKDVETFEGSVKINIRVYQEDFSVLKRTIESMNPVTLTRLITPAMLFKQPLEIVREESAQIFVKETTKPVKEPIRRMMQNKHCQASRKKRDAGATLFVSAWLAVFNKILGAAFSDPSPPCSTVWTTVEEDVIIQKVYRTFENVLYTYAVRFDGVVDLYSKTHANFVEVEA